MAKLNVRLFAALREAAGRASIEVEVPDGATIEALKRAVERAHPALGGLMPSVICAVNEEYVPGDFAIHDGDAVALIPPVSGGAS